MTFSFFSPSLASDDSGMAITSCASPGGQELMNRIDELAGLSQPAGWFAALYKTTTEKANEFYDHADPATREFIERLKIRFATIFFNALRLHEEGATVPGHWRIFFRTRHLKPVQYYLLGSNAHINGDICSALTTEFREDEIREQYHSFLHFDEGLKSVYDDLYRQLFQASFSTRMLHYMSGGLSKKYGYTCLKQWRCRQVKLALLHFQNPRSFRKKMKIVRFRMKLIDQLIVYCI